jgi:hypothetical protein
MDRKQRIEYEVQKALEQFEKAEQLPPDPYFYTRLKSRLDERQRSEAKLPLLLRPAFLALLFFLNIISAGWYLSSGNFDTAAAERQELSTLFASDFHVQQENFELLNLE